jgi:hypothetical protein
MISWDTCHCLKNKIKFHVYRPISAPSVVQSFAVLLIIHVKSILVLFGLATFDFLCSLFVLSIKSKTSTFVFFVFFMNHKIMYKYWFISYDMHSYTCDIYSCVTMLVYKTAKLWTTEGADIGRYAWNFILFFRQWQVSHEIIRQVCLPF